MHKVKENEKADFCLEYNGIAACNHRYASKEEQTYIYRKYKKPIKDDNPLITKYYQGDDGCCILQKKTRL